MRGAAELAARLPVFGDAFRRAGQSVVVIADIDGKLERWYFNEPAMTLIGRTAADLATLPPIEAIVPEQRPLMLQLFAAFRSGDAVPATIEIAVLHRDGSHVPVEIAIGHIPITGGRAYVGVLRPIGHPQTQMSLLEADRIGLVAALSAGFAHETNNPLTSVLLNLRSLRKQLLMHLPELAQPSAVRCLDDLTTGAERIASNVRALQTLATRSETQPIDLAAVVSAALRLATPTLEPCAHVIRQIFPVRKVTGEESRIGQAVLAIILFSASGFDPELSTSSNRIVIAVDER